MREVNFLGLVRDSIDRSILSAAVRTICDHRCNCSVATQVCGVEWIAWTTHVHAVGDPRHLCGRGRRAWEHRYHQSLLTSAHGVVTDHGQTA